MSACGLSDRTILRVGLCATVAGLILYLMDGLEGVRALHVAEPLHFVQGLLLGAGLSLTIGSRCRRRLGGGL